MKHFFSTFIMMLTVLFTYCKKNEVKPVPTVLPSDEVDHMPAGKSLHVKYIG